jgi:hypothetical protein
LIAHHAIVFLMRESGGDGTNQVPRAQVANVPVPLHRRAGVRKVVAVAALGAAGFGGWRILKSATRSDENKRLEARQATSRARIGHGLDPLFERQLDKDTQQVELRATFHLDSELTGTYNAAYCAKGLQEAFAQVLGPDIVTFSTTSMHEDPGLLLELSGTISPSGHDFKLPHSEASYPGIELAADMKLIGKTVHADVEPAANIQFEYTRYSTFSTDGASENEINGGILQNTCMQAGYVLLEQLTTWKRPPPPPPSDPVSDCKRGFNCRENADTLADRDPKTAETLYAEACEHGDATACTRLTNIVLEAPAATDLSLARLALDTACQQEVATACSGRATLSLISRESGKPPSEWQRREALVVALRGCDLGAREACAVVVPLLEKTPYAEAAPLLTGASTVASKRMGTIFGLHWGQWTKMDSGQPTLWVTREPHVPAGALVREFSRDKLPHGIVAPPDVETVYAIALRGGQGDYDTSCEHCKPSGGGDSIYSMRNLDCVCALVPQ